MKNNQGKGRQTTAQLRETNRLRIQIEMLKGYLNSTARGYGFCVDGVTTYLAVGTEIYYKIPSAKFLLDPKKIPKTRLIKVKMYKELFKKSQRLTRIYCRKNIRGETYSVLRLEDRQICIPSERLKNFGWSVCRFYGIDEFSPVFITNAYSHGHNEWKEVQGFVMPVPVSTYVLKAKDLQKLDTRLGRPRKNPIVEEKNDVNI